MAPRLWEEMFVLHIVLKTAVDSLFYELLDSETSPQACTDLQL